MYVDSHSALPTYHMDEASMLLSSQHKRAGSTKSRRYFKSLYCKRETSQKTPLVTQLS